ncbi:MAG: BatD family protein, partial [Verrucomicrobia bacterium]|nr:BatD family protein [Verrucomicrobiota bacterium]
MSARWLRQIRADKKVRAPGPGVAVLFGALALSVGAAQLRLNVSATLQPAQIGLNEAAQLAVTVHGRQNGQPELPRVDGLQFTPVGQSSSFQSINGAMTASVSHLYQVSATRAGTFTIPSIRVGNAATQPLSLQVVPQNGVASRSTGRALPPPDVDWSSAPSDRNHPADSQPAFLKVIAPRHELWVGELMPVQIKAYFRSGMSASLNGLPALSSDAFTMTKLTDNPDQSQEIVGGIPYTVITWPAALSAVKAGDYTLNLELPVLVRVQERAARGARRDPFDSFFGGSPFDDSFFNDFFGRVAEKPVTLQTEMAAMKILALPAAERPADFSGAVGQFQVHAEVTPTHATVGDPLTLKLEVNGTGNFDRVTSPGLAQSADWKTYQAGAQFEPADSVGYQGRKVFEQAVVPQQSGDLRIPALSFSFFDPETRQYVTRHTQPLPVEVAAGSGLAQAIPTTPPASTALEESTSSAISNPSELFPNEVETGRGVARLQPVLLQPGLVALPASTLALLACGLWWVKRRDRRKADSSRATNHARASALRASLAQMDSAVNAGEVSEFFSCARRALQERLAQRWHLPASAVTLAEVNTRLNGHGEGICAVFRAADQAAYAGF